MTTSYSPELAIELDQYYGRRPDMVDTSAKPVFLKQRGQVPYDVEIYKNTDTVFTGPIPKIPLSVCPPLKSTFESGYHEPGSQFELPGLDYDYDYDKTESRFKSPLLYQPRQNLIENVGDRVNERAQFLKKMADPRRIYLSRYNMQREIVRTQFFRTPEYVRVERDQDQGYGDHPKTVTEFY